jgi:hypothetical protein
VWQKANASRFSNLDNKDPFVEPAVELNKMLLTMITFVETVSTLPPAFSWETLPVHWFSANATSQLSAATADQIASRHSLAIINGQGHAYWANPVRTGAKAKVVEAGRRLKLASRRRSGQPTSVLAYFNSVLDWTAYDFHAWLSADKSRYLHGANGKCHWAPRYVEQYPAYPRFLRSLL